MIKPGSQVICIDNSGFEKFVQLDTPYEAREILPKGTKLYPNPGLISFMFRIDEDGIKLHGIIPNQIINGYQWVDMPFPLERFRELQLPGEVAEILSNEIELV